MGCGEARLAATISNTTHSFDLISANSNVIACDIAHVPLSDESVDIVVFCLSLMGTNVLDFLREAHRILRFNGILKIAEVRSRFEGEANALQSFLQTLKKLGFHVTTRDMSNTMFFMLEAVKKNKQQTSNNNRDTTTTPDLEELVIQPCLYKRR
jgi:ribosomal RNA-processing protein 8